MTSQSTKNILFASDLPNQTTLDDLAVFFSKYNFQYASLNHCKTSTWALVYFDSEDNAEKAKDSLNGDILTPKLSTSQQGKPIRLCRYEKKGSVPEKNIDQSLLVKNLDKKMTQKEFYQLFLQYGDIESAKIDYDEGGVSKGFGYIYYTSPESAEKAKQQLNQKEFYGKKMDIVNLIPMKSKDFINTLFIKNFPNDFKEEDMRKLFEKYGDIKHVSIARDQYGQSKGYGFISFADYEMALKCLNETNKNEVSFPGLLPLCVKIATRKADRENRNNPPLYSSDFLKVQFELAYAIDSIENAFDLEKEIRLFIKVILLQEYNPKEVIVDLESYTGVVTFNSKRDFDLFFSKFEEFCMSHHSSFYCFPYEVKKEHPQFLLPRNMNHSKRDPIPIFNNIPQLNHNSPQVFPNMALLNNDIAKPPTNQYLPQPHPSMQPPMPYPKYQKDPMLMSMPILQPRQPQPNRFNEANIPIWPSNHPNMPLPIRQPFNPSMMKVMPQPVSSNQLPFMPQEGMYNQPFPYFTSIESRMNNQSKQQQEKGNQKHIDPRNLQELNADQLYSQFNKPAQHIFNPDMFNHDDDEEISNEIAESIYEIAFKKYPK